MQHDWFSWGDKVGFKGPKFKIRAWLSPQAGNKRKERKKEMGCSVSREKLFFLHTWQAKLFKQQRETKSGIWVWWWGVHKPFAILCICTDYIRRVFDPNSYFLEQNMTQKIAVWKTAQVKMQKSKQWVTNTQGEGRFLLSSFCFWRFKIQNKITHVLSELQMVR